MRIIITCGDPNGIGLELLFRAMSHAQLAFDGVELALCAPPAIVRAYAEVLVRAGCIEPVHVGEASVSVGSSILPLLPIEGSADALQLGTPTRQSGMVAMAALECAARAVLAGECDAVVTLPVSKHALSAAGFPFPGQTEFWGSVAGANPLMILACSELRVALVTIHEPLARVAELITLEREIETIERFHRALAVDFAVQSPTIAVLGLNPTQESTDCSGRRRTPSSLQRLNTSKSGVSGRKDRSPPIAFSRAGIGSASAASLRNITTRASSR